MEVVKFKKWFDGYVEGEIAGLDDKRAEEAFKSGAAVEYKEGKHPVPSNLNTNATDKKADDESNETKDVDKAPHTKMVSEPAKKK